MTTPELISDAIVHKMMIAMQYYTGFSTIITPEIVRQALLEVQDDIVRPYRNVWEGYKRDAEAYEKALKDIRANQCINAQEIADAALKGDYQSD